MNPNELIHSLFSNLTPPRHSYYFTAQKKIYFPSKFNNYLPNGVMYVLYIYISIYTFPYIYTFSYIHFYIYAFYTLSIYIHIDTSSTYISIHFPDTFYIYIKFLDVYKHINIHIPVYTFPYIYIYTFIHTFLNIHICIHIYLTKYTYIHSYIHS